MAVLFLLSAMFFLSGTCLTPSSSRPGSEAPPIPPSQASSGKSFAPSPVPPSQHPDPRPPRHGLVVGSLQSVSFPRPGAFEGRDSISSMTIPTWPRTGAELSTLSRCCVGRKGAWFCGLLCPRLNRSLVSLSMEGGPLSSEGSSPWEPCENDRWPRAAPVILTRLLPREAGVQPELRTVLGASLALMGPQVPRNHVEVPVQIQ